MPPSAPAAEAPLRRQRGRPRSPFANPEAGSVQSLERAIALLRILAEHEGLSLTECARLSELAPSTTHRMLATLQLQRLAEFEEATQLWFIGVETFRIGSAFLRRRKLAERGRAIIEALRAATGETANLALAEEGAVVFVTQAESHAAIRAFFRPGTRAPYHASGIGKAILAFSTPARRVALVAGAALEPFTPSTRSDAATLAADLTQVAARGYALDDEERTPGMRCIAAPVFNELGEPFGGVSVSGPCVRVDDAFIARVAPLVIEAGRQLTEAIGGRGSP
jgi:IclR family acetate operon transcriptional repressor